MNPHSCVVLGCRNSVTGASRPNSACKFFNFPVGRKDLTEIWLRNINLEEWNPGPESFICEEHFSMDSFETNDCVRFLKSNAVPTIVDDLDRIISLYEQELCSQYREFLESPKKAESKRIFSKLLNLRSTNENTILRESMSFFPELRCRLCTVFISLGDAVNIHSDDGNLIKKILQCIPILARTRVKDHLPKYICRLCLSDLNISYRMLRRALESEEFFSRSLKCINEMNTLETTGQCVETDVYRSAVLADMANISDQNIPIDFDPIDSYTPDSISSFFELDRFEDNGSKSAAVEADGNNWSDENKTNSLESPMSGILNTCSPSSPAPVHEPMEQEKSLTAGQQDAFKFNGNDSASQTCFTCELCSTTYESKEVLDRHLETHIVSAWSEDSNIPSTQVSADPESYCKICAISLPSRESLMEHSKKVHELKYIGDEAQKYRCKECGKMYKSKHTLTVHKRVHTGDRPCICETCGRSFRSASTLRQHCLTHEGEKRFKCGLCDKMFGRKNSLQVHSRVHTGERPYRCHVCSNTYTQLGDLSRHKQKCHKAPH